MKNNSRKVTRVCHSQLSTDEINHWNGGIACDSKLPSFQLIHQIWLPFCKIKVRFRQSAWGGLHIPTYSSLLPLAPRSCGLSQAEKGITVMQFHKMTTIITQNDNYCHSKWHLYSSRTILSVFFFSICSALHSSYSLLSLR